MENEKKLNFTFTEFKQITFNNSPSMIINADDLGIGEERDQGIFDLFQKGCISSASILVNGPNFENSVNKAIELGLPLGIHLNLTEGNLIDGTNIEKNSLVCYDHSTGNYNMHGKLNFREKIISGKISEMDLKNEIINQILRFYKFYKNSPTHIDGHQHVHVIPLVASLLSSIMTEYFGIYQTRLPLDISVDDWVNSNTNLSEESKNFYKTVTDQAKESKKIFEFYGISFPDYFLGISLMGKNLTLDNFIKTFECLQKSHRDSVNSNNKNIFIELMCHPGNIPKCFSWDEFNCSDDRLHEKSELIKISYYLKNNNISLANFLDIESKLSEKFTILILGEFTFGTGNSITAIRLSKIIKQLNCNCYLYNIKYLNFPQLEKFLSKKKVNMIIGIHTWRSGKVLNHLRNTTWLRIPYCLIISGTDANYFINESHSLEVMKEAISNSEIVISFNTEMIERIKDKFKFTFCYEIIPQSISDSTIDSVENVFSIRNRLSLPESYKITLFPSGIRAIKDPKFVIAQILEILEEFTDHIFILIGARLDTELYEEIVNITNLQKRFIIYDVIPHEDFISLLKECQLVINTSIAEGMSNVLMEAMKVGVPILARANEGNSLLIEHEVNGLLFSTPEEFKTCFHRVYSDECLRIQLIARSRQLMNIHFSSEKESKKYKEIIEDFILKKYYKRFFNVERGSCSSKSELSELKNAYLYFMPKVHPFSEENNEIFSYSIINADKFENKNGINVLDVGCGSGVFSIIFLLKNKNLCINELVLTDIEPNCLYSTYQNILYLKHLFHINTVTIIKSDLLKSLNDEVFKNAYNNNFDIVLANMPQTPSRTAIRIDKHGGAHGYELYKRLFESISDFIKVESLIFILHISLCNPDKLDEFIKSLNFEIKKLTEQIRTLNPDELNLLSENESLSEYFIELSKNNLCEFEITESNIKEWVYKVWLKVIVKK